jgi:putative transposase
MNRIDKLHTDFPTYGSRTLAAALTQEIGYPVGRKRTRSLMERMGIEAIYPKPNLSRNDKEHLTYPYLLKGLTINHANHVWGTDITYIKMKHGFVYLTVFIDWYARYILSWRLSTTLETDFCIQAAQEAIERYGNPEIVNSDQGVQYTSHEYEALWDKEKTKMSMDHKGRCFDNIFTERFWRSLKYEEVYLKEYLSVPDARASIGAYIERYNTKRVHQALDYDTPRTRYLQTSVFHLLQVMNLSEVATKFMC